MKRFVLILIIVVLSENIYCKSPINSVPTTVLYHQKLNDSKSYPELIFNHSAAHYSNDGLIISKKDELVRLDKYYSLGERFIRYHAKFSDNTIATFQSNTGDFKVLVNLREHLLSIESNPEISKKIEFVNSKDEYILEIYHTYQQAKVKITNLSTGQYTEIEAVNDGPGGHGAGVINTGFRVGMQHDYYCFGLLEGDFLLVKQITVLSQKNDLVLLLYGDSITEPESYFPTDNYGESWTQLIMNHIKGKSMSSGRGGCTINEVLIRIKNELPYVKSKFVMVTIGTNGGNSIEKLSELVEYILAQNAIPILNNIPCNESQTHIEVNKQIEIVRQKYKLKGCRFDLVTSLNQDGLQVDKSCMFHEDYPDSWGQIYHHPNVKGSKQMFARTLIDIPEIYQ